MLIVLVFPLSVSAGPSQYQICEPNSDCVLGEFIFDNDYDPIVTDACDIKIINPSGDTVYDDATTFGSSDGWHGYTYATGSAAKGFYRTVLCCTDPDSLAVECLDKSFYIGTSFGTIEEQSSLIRKSTFDFTGVADSGTTSTIVDAELTQANDYWLNYKVVMVTGDSIGQEGTINDFDAASDTLTFTPAMTDAISAGDEYTLKHEDRLVFQIWNATTRTLTSLSNVAGDVWNVLTSGMNTTGSIGKRLVDNIDATISSRASQTSVNTIQSDVIGIGTSVNEIQSDVTGIGTKVDTVQTSINTLQGTANSIYADTQAISTTVSSILTKWGAYSASDIMTDLGTVKTRIGTSTDASTVESLFGRSKFLQEKWGTQTAQAIYDKADATLTKIGNVQTELGYNGKSTTAYDEVAAVKAYVDSLETSVGTSSDSATDPTLFGRVKKVQDKVDTLDALDIKVSNIQTSVDTVQDSVDIVGGKIDTLVMPSGLSDEKLDTIISDISDVSDEIKGVSSDVSGLDDMASVDENSLKEIKNIQNKLIEFKALIEVNRLLLEQNPIVKTYYEWGSVILKMVVANPVAVKQTVSLKTALPKEVKPEYIIDKNAELKIEYDPEKEMWFASADIELLGNESITKFVEVKDIWVISQDELDSLRNQANELVKPLEKTAYFASGVTLKSDSIARLDKIARVQKETAATPEEHIVDYRENLDDLGVIKKNIDDLNKLVTEVSNKNFLQGSIFGVSTTMTWAIILMVVVGVIVLLAALFILLKRSKERDAQVISNIQTIPNTRAIPNTRPIAETEKEEIRHPEKNAKIIKIFIAIGVAIILLLLIILLLVYFSNKRKNNLIQEIATNKAEVSAKSEVDTKDLQDTSLTQIEDIQAVPESSGKKIKVKETPIGWLNVRTEPSAKSALLDKLNVGDEVEYVGQQNNWYQISLKNGKTGWVSGEYVEEIKE